MVGAGGGGTAAAAAVQAPAAAVRFDPVRGAAAPVSFAVAAAARAAVLAAAVDAAARADAGAIAPSCRCPARPEPGLATAHGRTAAAVRRWLDKSTDL